MTKKSIIQQTKTQRIVVIHFEIAIDVFNISTIYERVEFCTDLQNIGNIYITLLKRGGGLDTNHIYISEKIDKKVFVDFVYSYIKDMKNFID